MSKVIVIGAGPAGMMAAITAAKEHKVTLLDGNERLGKSCLLLVKVDVMLQMLRIFQNFLITYLVTRIFYIVHYIHLLMKIL